MSETGAPPLPIQAHDPPARSPDRGRRRSTRRNSRRCRYRRFVGLRRESAAKRERQRSVQGQGSRNSFASPLRLGGLSWSLMPDEGRGHFMPDESGPPPYGNGTLPAGIRSRVIADVNGLTAHILEAGYETPGRPAVLAAAWLSGARLQLAQGDAAAGARPAITSSRPTSAAMAAPPAGTIPTTPIPIRFACSIWSATPRRWSSRSAIAMSHASSGTTRARR